MKKVNIESLRLPRGFPIMEYENTAEILKDGGTDERVTQVVNNYLHQKNGLVDGRDNLADYVEYIVKFPRSYKQVKRGENMVDVPAEAHGTEQKYLDAFVEAVVTKKFPLTAVVLGGDAEEDEKSVWAWLQFVVDKPFKGSITYRGATTATEVVLFDLKNDIKAPERKSGPAKLPEYAKTGATNIITNKTQAKWVKVFQAAGIEFEDFTVVPKGTAEEQAATLAENHRRLANAVWNNEKAEDAKKAAEKAKKYA